MLTINQNELGRVAGLALVHAVRHVQLGTILRTVGCLDRLDDLGRRWCGRRRCRWCRHDVRHLLSVLRSVENQPVAKGLARQAVVIRRISSQRPGWGADGHCAGRSKSPQPKRWLLLTLGRSGGGVSELRRRISVQQQ